VVHQRRDFMKCGWCTVCVDYVGAGPRLRRWSHEAGIVGCVANITLTTSVNSSRPIHLSAESAAFSYHVTQCRRQVRP